MVLISLFFKIAAAPFHMLESDVYQVPAQFPPLSLASVA